MLKKYKKSLCLNQLAMSDVPSTSFYESLIYRLSKFEGLGWFENVALVSSYQDTYAPYDSARIQISPKAEKDKKRG